MHIDLNSLKTLTCALRNGKKKIIINSQSVVTDRDCNLQLNLTRKSGTQDRRGSGVGVENSNHKRSKSAVILA